MQRTQTTSIESVDFNLFLIFFARVSRPNIETYLSLDNKKKKTQDETDGLFFAGTKFNERSSYDSSQLSSSLFEKR